MSDWKPLSTRHSRSKSLRWRYKGLRERIALKLAPWLLLAPDVPSAYEVKKWIKDEMRREEQLVGITGGIRSKANFEAGEARGRLSAYTVLAGILERLER